MSEPMTVTGRAPILLDLGPNVTPELYGEVRRVLKQWAAGIEAEAREAALDEVRREVEALPLYDGSAMTMADAAQSMRNRACAIIDRLREPRP